MTTHGAGAKDEMHSFYPPLSTTYFISWPFCDRAIHSLPCTTLSLWHTLRTCPLSSTHPHTHTSAYTNQPKQVILPAGNLYRFQSEKATKPQSGRRAPSLMCTGCPLWLHSSEAPSYKVGSGCTQSCDTHRELQQGPCYLFFLYINEWTDRRRRILSMKTAGHLSWLSNLFIPSGAITYQSSKLNGLCSTFTCHHSHSWKDCNSLWMSEKIKIKR